MIYVSAATARRSCVGESYLLMIIAQASHWRPDYFLCFPFILLSLVPFRPIFFFESILEDDERYESYSVWFKVYMLLFCAAIDTPFLFLEKISHPYSSWNMMFPFRLMRHRYITTHHTSKRFSLITDGFFFNLFLP